MKGWLIISSVTMIGVCLLGAMLPAQAMIIEREGYYSMGLYGGEKSLFAVSGQSDESDEREFVLDLAEAEEGEPPLCTLSGSGQYTRIFEKEDFPDDRKAMNKLGFESKEEVLSFLTVDPLISLRSPLMSEELGELFYLILSLSKGSTPVDGSLEKITFMKKGENLLVYAEIEISFERLRGGYGLDFFPEKARLSAMIPFDIQNSEISAYYEKVFICCDECDLSDALLSIGCGAVTGEKSGKCFLVDAVGNVIRNACFSR